jgi:type IV pilus assembly protein PilN
MYGLDINFLNDRAERPSEASLGKGVKRVKDDPRPFYIGLAAAIALPALVLGAWAFLANQNSMLAKRQSELDGQLAELQAQLSAVQSVNTRVNQIEAENQALATVFDRIKPWSAILQDVRSRVPNGVQIDTIEQQAGTQKPKPAPAPSPSPSASPAAGNAPAAAPAATAETPAPTIQISGKARSFNDVNDFVLTLQRSPFFDNQEVRLVKSKLIDNPTQVEFSNDNRSSSNLEVQLPKVVEYTIEGGLTNLPASELLQDLERTLSVGLATRIQALRDRGVLKP